MGEIPEEEAAIDFLINRIKVREVVITIKDLDLNESILMSAQINDN